MAQKEDQTKKMTQEELEQYVRLLSRGNATLIASGGKTVLITDSGPKPEEKKK